MLLANHGAFPATRDASYKSYLGAFEDWKQSGSDRPRRETEPKICLSGEGVENGYGV